MTKAFNISSRALLLLLILSSAGVVVSGQTRKSRFDPDGSFWISGEAPNDFSDFGGINLNAKKVRRLPSSGVQLNNGRTFRFKLLNVTQERFTFTTVVLSNISYSFAGKFLRGGIFGAANLDDETPVLEGLLTKYKRGKKVAEARLKFVYFGGT